MKKRTTNREVSVPILNNEYKVIVCWGSEQFIRKVATLYHYPKDDTVTLGKRRGVTYRRHDCHPLIVLPRSPKTPQEIGTLAHEATHAILDIYDKVGEDNIAHTEEVFCHSVGAVVREVLKKLKP